MTSRPKSRRSSFWKELPILLGVAILVAVLVRAFVLQTFFIPSPSMENTLEIDDRVLVNKLVYDFRSPHRGEVIVFKAPDRVERQPGAVRTSSSGSSASAATTWSAATRRTGWSSTASRWTSRTSTPDGQQDKPPTRTSTSPCPQGRLWVMGDHRSASGDSLEHWQQSGQDITEATIPEDQVVGRAFTVFWPVSRATWLSVPKQFDGIPNP